MSKKIKSTEEEILDSLDRIKEILSVVEAGYPFYGVPQDLKRIRRSLKRILKGNCIITREACTNVYCSCANHTFHNKKWQ